MTIVELEGIPAYNFDLEATAYPGASTAIKNEIAVSEAVLIVTPEYLYSVSGVLKNALDWISRPPGTSGLADKPVGIMGASPGMTGTARAQMQLRQMLLHERAMVMSHPQLLIHEARRRFDADGNLTDPETRERVKTFMEALVRWTERLSALA